MPRFLELEKWPRRGTFDFFRTFDNPYFNVCTALEVGPLVRLARADEGTSFFLAYLYLSLRAANELEPFRYRIRDGRVLVHERIHAGSTVPVDDDRFAFAYFDFEDGFSRFQAAARQVIRDVEARARDGRLDARDDRTDLVHYSTLPWISFSSFAHARNWKREDSVPKIVFGKYSDADGRVRIPVSVEVHHALMDGLHVGRYLELLQEYFLDPEATLDN